MTASYRFKKQRSAIYRQICFCQRALIRESLRKLRMRCHQSDNTPDYRLHYLDIRHFWFVNILECEIQEWLLPHECFLHHRRMNAGLVAKWYQNDVCFRVSLSQPPVDTTEMRLQCDYDATDIRRFLSLSPWYATSVSVDWRQRFWSYVIHMSTAYLKHSSQNSPLLSTALTQY